MVPKVILIEINLKMKKFMIIFLLIQAEIYYPPSGTGSAVGNIPTTNKNEFAFRDEGPVETVWRRSSFHSFSLMILGIESASTIFWTSI